MHEKHILCSGCGREYPLKELIFRCRECGDSLEVVFDYGKLKRAVSRFKTRPFNHMRYRELYPVKEPLSLGEGGTALIRSRNLERGLKFQLWFKCEFQNPSGSFKDRGSSVEVARALEMFKAQESFPRQGSGRLGLGKGREVVCASTGNMGASVAAYSAAAGLECSIFTPRDAPPVKLEQILAYGARVLHVNANYAQVARIVEQAFEKYGAYLLGDYLFRREGTKSVGFEIAEQLASDYVFCPIGNGTLISAVWKAMKEFKTLGLLAKMPRVAGIQASGCSPLVKAHRKGKPIKPVCGETLATAIHCGDPMDGVRALQAVKESHGFLEAVTDKEILRARELLARQEGLFAEPAGAAALAGVLKARKQVKRGSKVVCLVTGHGLKTPYTGVKGRVREAGLKVKLGKLF